ncbi:O-antigen ligase family protein [Sphingobacterium sp. FBM7-1]|uniref:O-antigen ligase family protein n=1 Tax=Sphingobacterium sp. FBM7-1 TaxID=2886688 RepID=UPI001D12595B|nr:O-antigen ligase family protein [Sphingobacterium sp. FBM7-1]MCC2600320.1 O-antigen ligase family protein [Sphingobacterium sp. FBM7-1]
MLNIQANKQVVWLIVIITVIILSLSSLCYNLGHSVSTQLSLLLVVCSLLFSVYVNNYANSFTKNELIFFLFLLGVGLVFFQNKSIQNIYLVGLMFCVFLFLKRIGIKNHIPISIGLVLYAIFEGLYGIVTFHTNLTGAIGHFDNAAGFAVVQVAIIPFSIHLLTVQKKVMKFMGIIGLLIAVVAIYLSGSRSGIFSASTLVVLYLIYGCRDKLLRFSSFKKLAVGITCLIGLLTFIFILYQIKKDSANGRLLIWKCSINMVLEKPLLGYGTSGFKTRYMFYQAAYLKDKPESPYANLADDVTHPFNEYLDIIVKYGIIGFVAFLFLLALLMKSVRVGFKQKKYAFFSTLGVLIFGFFSYPFQYTTLIIIMTINLWICLSLYNPEPRIFLSRLVAKPILSIGLAFAGLFLLYNTIGLMKNDREWGKIREGSMKFSEVDDVISKYENLLKRGFEKESFLFNYGARLNQSGDYRKSIQIFEKCTQHVDNSQIQTYMADNYLNLGNYVVAEEYAQNARYMRPSTFLPLYHLVIIYNETARYEEAQTLALHIIDKPMKIHNANSHLIKYKMKQYTETGVLEL